MSGSDTQWQTLKEAFRSAVEALPGYRVTHAVFTTYAFEPEFFETSILPLLLPDGDGNLSLHSAVRRLQIEAILRETPVAIDVYFDAHVVMPGCPLLPYGMKAMRGPGEFHGKVILLRLEDEEGNVRCILGAGSANLTQAGWWENIEAWHFAQAFDPLRPPGSILPGVKALLAFLVKSGQAGGATRTLDRLFKPAEARRVRRGEPEFGVFLPGVHSFLEWLGDRVTPSSANARLEVISPYFADTDHAALTNALLDATHSQALDLWLPIDPWQAGGAAALIEECCFKALSEVDALRWSQMSEKGLVQSRKPDQTPRFLHAKVIRQAGNFCFMGSVNFSNKAFRVNYEAGFLFRDEGVSWLEPMDAHPSRFLKPAELARHQGMDDTLPELLASFDWQTRMLLVDFVHRKEAEKFESQSVRLVDAQGAECRRRVTLKARIEVKADESLYQDLKTNPWIRLAFPDGRLALVWVQQDGLEYRPPPENLRPDVWRILDMWRGLAGGRKGSGPGDFEELEIFLKQRFTDTEAPPEGAPEQDMFEEMAVAHGSFYLLRRSLQEAAERGNAQRCEYYFCAPRPDTLASLVDRFDRPGTQANKPDALAAWVILQWVIQICLDHKNLRSAKLLRRRAEAELLKLLAEEPLCALDARFLEWAARMFLCEPGRERGVTRYFKQMESPQ
ncbi:MULTISPECIES: phospholipase D-like domain-containing protein [unclassified Paraburkholderia]|uniref:phospholipase D-like domain-containing protein n=1 Tax=unclassified Paraburkholderia TaxID=2615204 RepID=UPI002AB318A5|nr:MULTISPECIES: phospholipase D-like domain-containing protein [unclassified Paraburkholderia]